MKSWASEPGLSGAGLTLNEKTDLLMFAKGKHVVSLEL